MDWTSLAATVGTLIAAVGGAIGVLVLLSGWLGRVWATRIAQQERAKLEADLERTKHDFAVKLEQVRAEIRFGEERLNAVRSTALDALSSGAMALNQRRLQAADILWKSIGAVKQGSMVAQMWGTLNRDQVTARRNEPATQALLQFLETMVDQFVANLKTAESAESARPYVTPMAWALYSAYTSIVLSAVVTVKALRFGVPPSVLKSEFPLNVVKAAMPEAHALVEQFGEKAFANLMPEIEERLLAELRASAEGRDSDAEGVARAKKVAELVTQHEVERARKDAGLQE